jgi:hypothetical protein
MPLDEIMPGFQKVCTVEVDALSMRSILEPKSTYWVLDYDIAFTFGSTELKAYVVWEENVRNAPCSTHFFTPESMLITSLGVLGCNTPGPSFHYSDPWCRGSNWIRGVDF